MSFEGILYRLRTGIPWRDLPLTFGKWGSVFNLFNEWSAKGLLQELFKTMTKYGDSEWLFIDGSIVKAHQDSAGARSVEDEAIGRSRGGKSTKIHLAVDSGGLPIHFELSGGQVNDIVHAENLISKSPLSDNVIADKGYDSEKLRAFIREHGSQSNIPRRESSKRGNEDMDWCLYKYRHLVENGFLKLKKYRAIATRYDKLARNYHSMVTLACIIMWLPMWVD